MKITFDPAKRDATLTNRGLDFAHADEVFAGLHATLPDDRQDYGEPRFISAGMQAGGGGLDAAGRRTAHYLDEART